MKIMLVRYLAGALLAALWAIAPAHAETTMRDIRVAVFGDSLTSGYELAPDDAFPAKLAQKFKEVGFNNVDVINMSVAGETTSGGLERLDALVARHPDIVILELGTNDALRGVNPSLVNSNLSAIVRKLQQNSVYVILAGTHAPANMGEDYQTQIDGIYDTLANIVSNARSGGAFYPFILEGVVKRPELNLGDSIHPNAKGVEVMVENMYPLVDAAVRWKWEILSQQPYQQPVPPDEVPLSR